MPAEVRRSVQDILEDLHSLNSLRELLSRLNYDPVLKPIERHSWGKAAEALAEDPQIVAVHGEFQIIYLRLASNSLLITHERPVINKLLQQHPYALFVFSTKDQVYWHFVNVKYDKDTSKRRIYRRLTVGPNEKLRTAVDRLSLLDLESVSPDLFGIEPLTIQARHDEAFDVEAVSKKFYLGYSKLFWDFVDAIKKNNKGKSHFVADDGELNARRFTQLVMGRVLIPASIMESPETFNIKVAEGFSIRKLSSEIVSANSSSAGDGQPAATVPRIRVAFFRDKGISLPLSSLLRTFPFSSC